MHLLILILTVSASKLSFIFFIFLNIITFNMFFCFLPIFWHWAINIYVFCITITEKDSHPALVLYHLLHIDISGMCCRLGLGVPNCAVVSRVVLGCSIQYWMFIFFLKFQLMLGTISPSVGSEFSHLWCCLSRCWLTVNSPCSSWFLRSIFGYLTSMLFFIARGRHRCIADFVGAWSSFFVFWDYFVSDFIFFSFFTSTCSGQDTLCYGKVS